MGYVIIILVILIIYFWSSNNSAQEKLIEEKSRIENFIILLNILKDFDCGFRLVFPFHNNATLYKEISHPSSKSISFRTTKTDLNITITLTDKNNKKFSKYLKYPINLNQQDTAETVKAEFLYFESKLLKENSQFYKITLNSNK
ncbi:hypothetical protein [Flavobacterium sp. MMS24-S5]|uniref:hypothetical protein n=1 Tax=Flavobacterium sp. MMS24-S5 TaxID=3416605 RepID=UPI003CFCDC3F